MALAFETMAAEQRETARLATTRRRDTWKRDTELERHLHSTAEVTAATRTEFEDAVVAAGLLPAEDITKEAKLRAGRRAWTRMDNLYKRLEVATKFGLKAAERLFDAQEEVEGITQEEEKRLTKVLKQLEDETKEKTGRKRRDREETDEAEYRPQENYMMYGGGGGYGQMGGGMPMQAPWGWDPAQGQGYGYGPTGGWPGFGGGPMAFGQGGQIQYQGSSGGNSAAAGAATTGQGADKGGLVNKKKICINCGSNDHISYNPICPNYSIHMQQLAAKAANIQRTAASQGQASTDRTVALRDGKGESHIKIMNTNTTLIDVSITRHTEFKWHLDPDSSDKENLI